MNEEFISWSAPSCRNNPRWTLTGISKGEGSEKKPEPGCGRGHAQWCSPNPQLCDQHWPTGFQTVLVCPVAMWGNFAQPTVQVSAESKPMRDLSCDKLTRTRSSCRLTQASILRGKVSAQMTRVQICPNHIYTTKYIWMNVIKCMYIKSI